MSRLPDISTEIKAGLQDYSTDDIEKKLIPFKKRQFNDLQLKERKLKAKIERARSKSKSTTPRRLSESSDILKSSPPLVIASPIIEQQEEEGDTFDPRRVSPLKLSLRGVVIQQPSSSSNSLDATPDTQQSLVSKDEISEDSSRKKVSSSSQVQIHDDNAVFPGKTKQKDEDETTPSKKDILDVSRDLVLTDDSDIEQSPVKKASRKKISAPKTPVAKKNSLSFEVLKELPLTPKDNLDKKKLDITSPQGISSLLKSPLVSHSILATSSPVSTRASSQKPSSTKSPEAADENLSAATKADNNSSKLKKRNRFTRSEVKLS